MKPIFYIEDGDCTNCYQCVRVCPVSAISINNFKASIISSRCINCTKCVDVCPQNLVKFDTQIEKCKTIIRNNETIIASLSPAWVGEFKNVTPNKMVEALKLLGFTYVNETTLGADAVINETFKKIKESQTNINITTICPVVNNLITKKYPHLVDYIVAVESPTVVHARQLKQKFGENVKVITIGSCMAGREEVENHNGLISASITFNELKEWLKEAKISMRALSGHNSYNFEPLKAKEHTEYVVRGAIYNKHTVAEMVSSDSLATSTSGIKNVIEALDNLKDTKFDRKTVLDFFACNGGCVFSEGASQKRDQFVKLNRMREYDIENMKNPAPVMPIVSLNRTFSPEYKKDRIDGSSIISLLQTLTIDTSKEYLNCGACGYFDCREFAKQIIMGYAHKEMCLWYRKSSAKMSLMTIIKGLPFGVAIVDSSMSIRSSNLNFAIEMGPEAELAFETFPLLKGKDIGQIAPSFTEYINYVFKTGKFITNKDIQIKDKLFKLSIIKIDDIERVVVIVRNIFQDDFTNDEIVDRARRVIDDNLKTVQQIAYLLGETASRTEAVLNSIIESQNISNESK